MNYLPPVVCLIGRPNVGKSTLFNRLTKSRDALVADVPGLTRDRIYGKARSDGFDCILIDTGGFEPTITDGIMYYMLQQSKLAITEADIIIFVVDGKYGITPQDKLIANELRILTKPIYVAVNKVEGIDKAIAISDFYALGLTNLYPISATHNHGVANLFYQIACNYKKTNILPETKTTSSEIVFSIIGRPNVGKSTLVNAILGEERVISFDQPGTTRDSVFIEFNKLGKRFTIIDTAGIRKRGKRKDIIEKFSVIKALQAIECSNVVVLVLDALDIAAQDISIISYALDNGKALVVAVNKWDITHQRQEIKEIIKYKFHFLDYAKFIYISALRKQGINELVYAIVDAYTAAFIKLSTPKVTQTLLQAVTRQLPTYKGKFRAKLRYAHQGGSNPPRIIIHGNNLETISKSYTKYLERCFRQTFALQGTPLTIEYRNSTNPLHVKQ